VPAKSKRPPIYDTKADGAKQITGALAVAKRDTKTCSCNRPELVQLCHKLHNLFRTDKDIAAFLKANYACSCS